MTQARSQPKDLAKLVIVVDLDYCQSEKYWLSLLGTWSGFSESNSIAIQVRIKNRSEQEVELLAKKARGIVDERIPLWLNGYPRLASDLGYSGVHFPENQWQAVEKYEASNMMLSVASHSLEHVNRVSGCRISMILYSPIFESNWKSSENPTKGIDGLKEANNKTDIPIFALGGVTADRVRECMSAGAAGVAVVSAILGSSNPLESTMTFLDVLSKNY